MVRTYDAKDIQVLEGLDAVRLRPGMYIGSTGLRGLHRLVWEIVDNAIDEAANGFADLITIILHKDHSVSVMDNGRGIPVDNHPDLKLSGTEIIFTQLHAGGKFSNDNYSYSGGLHGVGASVVNALSEWLKVDVYRNGNIYRQEYQSIYDTEKKKIASGKPVSDLHIIGKTKQTGTKITFKPDFRVFEDIVLSHDLIARRLKELAFLNKGIHITLIDEHKIENDKPKENEFSYKGGIKDFVKYLNEDKISIHTEPIYFEGEKDGIYASIAIHYTDSYTESIFSYVNSIPTSEGGTHETGFKAGVTKILSEYARKNNLVKERDLTLNGEDFREGMTAVISIKMQNIQFEGQTKTKLGNTEAKIAIENITIDGLSSYMEDRNNNKDALLIMDKAINAAKVREAARKAKEITRKKNSLEGAPLVGKLASCTGRNAAENELFIVEGDSAGGSAKQGRDRKFQAILPLRGKPLNVEKKRLEQVLANEEFRTIITALGTSIDADFSIKNLKYNKVIILSDADQDGAHIRAILLTFFFRYMKELITEGHVYIGLPPLYKISKANHVQYTYNDKGLLEITKKMGRGYSIQRYKGLGEMNPEQLWETTMNPQNRTLIQVTVDDAAEVDRMVTLLMGDRVDPRRDYISNHANFNKVDRYAELEVR